jgi:anti-sigma factor RsiW
VKVGCRDVIPLLGGWLDREIGSDDAARVEGHVMECPACSDRMAVFAAQGEALRVAINSRTADQDLTGLSQAIVARVRRREARKRFVWRPAAATMGMAAALAMAVVGLRTLSRSPVEAPAPVRMASVDEVDFHGAQGFVLQSGATSIIWLRERAGQ